MNTGEQPVFSENGLVTTIAWGLDGNVTYALEGSVFVAGAAIQWLRDEMRLIGFGRGFGVYGTERCRIRTAAMSYPHLRDLVRRTGISMRAGRSSGLTRGVNKYHIIRATLESLAYQVLRRAAQQ